MQLYNTLGGIMGAGGAVAGAGAGTYASAQSGDFSSLGTAAGAGAAIGGAGGYALGSLIPNLSKNGEAGVAAFMGKGLALQPFKAYNNSFQLASGNVAGPNMAKAAIGSFAPGIGVAGAMAGGAIGLKASGGDAQAAIGGAVIGGAIGGLLPAAAGVATAGIGAGLIAGAKYSPQILSGIGSGIIGGAKYGGAIGAMALGSTGHNSKYFAQRDAGKWSDAKGLKGKAGFLGNVSDNYLKRAGYYMGNPVQKYSDIGKGIMGNLVKYQPGEHSVGKNGKMKYTPGRLRLGKLGAIAGVVGMGGAALGNFGKNYDNRQGQSAGVQTATPRPYSFQNNGGATGDLVFALHNNR